jgi:hypothetical protein
MDYDIVGRLGRFIGTWNVYLHYLRGSMKTRQIQRTHVLFCCLISGLHKNLGLGTHFNVLPRCKPTIRNQMSLFVVKSTR